MPYVVLEQNPFPDFRKTRLKRVNSTKKIINVECRVCVSFIPLFGFLVTFGNEVTKIRKYKVILVYILQGKMGKTEKKTERKSLN